MTATATAATLSTATDFILNQATETDIEAILRAVNARQRMILAQRAAVVTIGATVTFANLKPKYLNGLTGTVSSISGTSASILLDKESTDSIRYRRTRFTVPAGVEQYTITGLPLECLVIS